MMRATTYFILGALAACGPDARNGSGDDDGTTDAGGGGGGGGGDSGGGGGGGGGCSDSAKLVYVVDEGNQMYSFAPETKTFTLVGDLSCPTTGSDPLGGSPSPFSMGVDRNTIAWVLYSDGEVFHVDINNNLACTKTSYHGSALTEFGMGFSTDTVGGDTDTLFIAGGTDAGASQAQLAKLDTSSMATTNVAKVTGQPEMTGNSNAELWGFFPSDENGLSTPRVEQINKTTGASIKNYNLAALQGVPTAWAFAFYGGDYWIFLAKDDDVNTTVYQVDGATGSVKSTTPTSRVIVGAGVSTCAPIILQ
jgi:hypothetical protein